MRVEEGDVGRGVLHLAGGKVGLGRRVGEVVEVVGVDLGDAGAQEGADEELEALEFGLEDDEAEVGFGVRVPRLLFDKLNLFGGGGSLSANVVGASKRATYLPTYSLQNTFHQSIRPWHYFWGASLRNPCSGEFLQILSLAGKCMAVYLRQDVVNIH